MKNLWTNYVQLGFIKKILITLCLWPFIILLFVWQQESLGIKGKVLVSIGTIVALGILGSANSDNTTQNINSATEKEVVVLESEVIEEEPMLDEPPISGPEIGKTYQIDRMVPLMPEHSPKDVLKALELLKEIPKGGSFEVLSRLKKDNNIWYEVIAVDDTGENLGKGWVKEIALLGQSLVEVAP